MVRFAYFKYLLTSFSLISHKRFRAAALSALGAVLATLHFLKYRPLLFSSFGWVARYTVVSAPFCGDIIKGFISQTMIRKKPVAPSHISVLTTPGCNEYAVIPVCLYFSAS